MTHRAIARATQLSPQEQASLDHQVAYPSVTGLPQIWPIAAEQFGETVALHDPHAKPPVSITFQQLWQCIQQFAVGLQSLGVMPEAHVALFSENQPRWMMADQGIMTAGAVSVVRSSQADSDELLYILENSDATVLIVENLQTLHRLRDSLKHLPIHLVILLSDEDPPAEPDGNSTTAHCKTVRFTQVLDEGARHPLQPPQLSTDSLATLLYTSGTTGRPKGVMLTHGNLLHQVTTLGAIVSLEAGDRILSLLPTWHIYERTVEYFALSQGSTLTYTDLRHFKRDLKDLHPRFFVSVPRLLEALHEGILKQMEQQIQQQSPNRQRLIRQLLDLSRRYILARRQEQGLTLAPYPPSFIQRWQARALTLALAPAHSLADRLIYQTVREGVGGNLKQIINGGGSLSLELDTFFEQIGLDVIVGYGLSETSPVLTARRSWHNLRGSAGKPIPDTDIRIVDPETRQTLAQGQQGSVLARGPQIMRGYYKNPEATKQAIDANGWFDTEDRGWLTVQRDLILTGRIKDTIVLSNGENVEPQPLEDACSRSPYIDQMVVVGQDQRSLGALIVPKFEALTAWANDHAPALPRPLMPPESGEASADLEQTLNSPSIHALIRQELIREIKNRPGYSANDRIGPIHLLPEPFTIQNGMMTQTLKVKRHVVLKRYHDLINQMFA